MKSTQTVYFTKYALSSGISSEVLADDFGKYEGSILIVNKTRWGTSNDLVSDKFIHETMEEALKHAEQLRDKKLASLAKQMGKLKAKVF